MRDERGSPFCGIRLLALRSSRLLSEKVSSCIEKYDPFFIFTFFTRRSSIFLCVVCPALAVRKTTPEQAIKLVLSLVIVIKEYFTTQVRKVFLNLAMPILGEAFLERLPGYQVDVVFLLSRVGSCYSSTPREKKLNTSGNKSKPCLT